ncbi:MAG: hypothetical protein J6Q42_01845 [Clostridia bacterium]|jgi:hypothetical protein|nr:hypothetical protein [Clostridia bacterium]
MKTVLMVMMMVLVLYAVADLIFRLAFRFLFAGVKQKGYYVLSLGKGAEEAEYAVRCTAALRWFFPFKNLQAVVVDCGMDTENRLVTATVCEDLQLTFCTQKEWQEMTQNSLQPLQNEV